VTPLAALVRDPDAKVRLEVVRALRELRDLSAVPAIVTSLSDGEPQIREEAIGSLVEIYADRDRGNPVGRFLELFSDEFDRSSVAPHGSVDPSVIQALAGKLADEDKAIRQEAAYALGILNGTDALPALTNSLRTRRRRCAGRRPRPSERSGPPKRRALVPPARRRFTNVRTRPAGHRRSCT